MAKTRSVNAVLIMALVATLWTVSNAQSSSCTNVLISLSPCLNYITGNSSTPSSSCCSQLKSVVNSQPQCLCEVITGNAAASLGININKTQALQLPSACNVQTPSISRCTGASSPSGSPSTSSNPSSSSSSPTISTGSKAVPSVDSSEGHVTKLGFALSIALFLIAGHA